MNAGIRAVADGPLGLSEGRSYQFERQITVPNRKNRSDIRGIKQGWYAIEVHGKFFLGPFPSFEECVTRMSEPLNGTTASEFRQGPN